MNGDIAQRGQGSVLSQHACELKEQLGGTEDTGTLLGTGCSQCLLPTLASSWASPDSEQHYWGHLDKSQATRRSPEAETSKTPPCNERLLTVYPMPPDCWGLSLNPAAQPGIVKDLIRRTDTWMAAKRGRGGAGVYLRPVWGKEKAALPASLPLSVGCPPSPPSSLW